MNLASPSSEANATADVRLRNDRFLDYPEWPERTESTTLSTNTPKIATESHKQRDKLDVTEWLVALRNNDDAKATELLWEYVRPRVQSLSARLMASAKSVVYDEDDLALSSFHALCRAVGRKRYDLANRTEMWKLLTTILLNKFRNRVNYESAECRNKGLSTTTQTDIESTAPSPAQIAELNDKCEYLFQLLKDPSIRRVAMLKVEGYTNEEIAQIVGCSESSVQRRIEFIRRIWGKEL